MSTIRQKIQLSVINSAPTDAGYKSTLATDKAGKKLTDGNDHAYVYYFKYIGGDTQHNDGTVTHHTDNGPQEIPIHLGNNTGYVIDSVTFQHDGDAADYPNNNGGRSQLGIKGKKNESGHYSHDLTITNANNASLNGRYTVRVRDTTKSNGGENFLIPCDPPIMNTQRN